MNSNTLTTAEGYQKTIADCQKVYAALTTSGIVLKFDWEDANGNKLIDNETLTSVVGSAMPTAITQFLNAQIGAASAKEGTTNILLGAL